MEIYSMINYPDDGNHLECNIGLEAFEIRKGEDGYFYSTPEGERAYNLHKSGKIDTRWIVNLTEDANSSLRLIFRVQVGKNLDKIIKYCIDIYRKSLNFEIKKIDRIQRLYLLGRSKGELIHGNGCKD